MYSIALRVVNAYMFKILLIASIDRSVFNGSEEVLSPHYSLHVVVGVNDMCV